MDWNEHFPEYCAKREIPKAEIGLSPEEIERINAGIEEPLVRFADVGCGYGGLLMALSPLFPDTLMLGLEIRIKVEDYVKKKIHALRSQSKEKGDSEGFANISVLRTNAQKFLPNYFHQGQVITFSNN